MKKTLWVILHEIRAALGRKSFLIMGLGLPLAIGIVALVLGLVNRDATLDPLGFAAGDAAAPVVEGYVDEAGLIERVPTDIAPGRFIEYADQGAALTALRAGEIEGFYLIPADYVESGALSEVRLRFDLLHQDSSDALIRWLLVSNLVDQADLAEAVRHPLDVRVTRLAVDDEQAAEESWIGEMLPTIMALILYMGILIPAGTLINAVTDEKKNRIMEVLISSISPQQMIGGKVLAMGLLGLLQLAMWLATLLAVVQFGGRSLNIPAGYALPLDLLIWAGIYGLLGYAMYGAQMVGVGALAPDLKDSRTITFVVMAPLIVVYMFMITIVIAPNGPAALVFSFFPLTSPVGMIARMTSTDVPLWQLILAAGLQVAAVVLIVRLVARLFRAQYLLSGQAFSVGRFYRALLERP